jgi:hypothetical protein
MNLAFYACQHQARELLMMRELLRASAQKATGAFRRYLPPSSSPGTLDFMTGSQL